MTRRETVVWYIVYGLVLVLMISAVWWLVKQDRAADAVVVILMSWAASWISMSNHNDPLEQPVDPGPDSY